MSVSGCLAGTEGVIDWRDREDRRKRAHAEWQRGLVWGALKRGLRRQKAEDTLAVCKHIWTPLLVMKDGFISAAGVSFRAKLSR